VSEGKKGHLTTDVFSRQRRKYAALIRRKQNVQNRENRREKREDFGMTQRRDGTTQTQTKHKGCSEANSHMRTRITTTTTATKEKRDGEANLSFTTAAGFHCTTQRENKKET
jgi:hypothetical protein